jgi:hypothetical protein
MLQQSRRTAGVLSLTLLWCATGTALANGTARRDLPLAFRPDLSAAASHSGRSGITAERTPLACHQLHVCAKLEAEALIERLDSTTPGAFLRLTSGVGLGYRF